MPRLAVIAPRLYSPDPVDDGVVLIEDSHIRAAGPRAAIEIPPGYRELHVNKGCVTPGFLDIHVHGAGGGDLLNPTPETLETVCRSLARFGTTSFFPTTATMPLEKIRGVFAELAKRIDERAESSGAAQPLGIHMEGPYISKIRPGVHPVDLIRPATLETLAEDVAAAQGKLKLVTIAPEEPGALEVIREMTRLGVRASIGHTNATFEEARAAVEAGARQATHTFNAMRPFAHRDPGVIGLTLTDERVTAELIADCVHVHPRAMELLYRAKGPDGVALISDGVSATGMPDGPYRIGDLEIQVADGVCLLGGKLAGSVLTIDRAIRNMVSEVGVPLEEALRMASWNPARLMGVEERKGSLRSGADADLVILDESHEIRQVFARGAPVSN